MTLYCEVCGSQVKNPVKVEIDGAILSVCMNCSRLGRRIVVQQRARAPARQTISLTEDEFEIDPDYSTIIRNAREKMGLSQEQLGRMINVKPSVISHIETGRMKPDYVLAKKLMHYLKVNILVRQEELEKR